MATIGLDKLFYAEITEDSDGNETYGVPASLAKAISADLSCSLYCGIDLIYDGFRGNMSHYKEVTLCQEK